MSYSHLNWSAQQRCYYCRKLVFGSVRTATAPTTRSLAILAATWASDLWLYEIPTLSKLLFTYSFCGIIWYYIKKCLRNFSLDVFILWWFDIVFGSTIWFTNYVIITAYKKYSIKCVHRRLKRERFCNFFSFIFLDFIVTIPNIKNQQRNRNSSYGKSYLKSCAV